MFNSISVYTRADGSCGFITDRITGDWSVISVATSHYHCIGETSNCFEVQRVLTQGCNISTHLFNIYAENIMENDNNDYDWQIRPIQQ